MNIVWFIILPTEDTTKTNGDDTEKSGAESDEHGRVAPDRIPLLLHPIRCLHHHHHEVTNRQQKYERTKVGTVQWALSFLRTLEPVIFEVRFSLPSILDALVMRARYVYRYNTIHVWYLRPDWKGGLSRQGELKFAQIVMTLLSINNLLNPLLYLIFTARLVIT